ncbi:MAG: hypothetical protein ACUVTQ_03665 [Desulfotomaculales bacterium]
MSRRLVGSFLVRLVHEPDNEQIPWRIIVQHVQTGRTYRLTEPERLPLLFQEVIKEKSHPGREPAGLETGEWPPGGKG